MQTNPAVEQNKTLNGPLVREISPAICNVQLKCFQLPGDFVFHPLIEDLPIAYV